MSTVEEILLSDIKKAIHSLYNQEISGDLIQLQKTRKDFDGDVTLVVFPLLKSSRKTPEQTGNEIGNYLKENCGFVSSFKVVKGFLNLEINNIYWINFLKDSLSNDKFGLLPENSSGKSIMVEYSSPNTNKPLHLGHIRNNLLGYSVANLLKANGHKVIKVNLVNDRGIHICKSMLAWEKWGEGETPDSTKLEKRKKGDHLVGYYYVMFNTALRIEIFEILKAFSESIPRSRKAKKYKKSIISIKENITEILHRNDVFREPNAAFKISLIAINKLKANKIVKNHIKNKLYYIIRKKLSNTLLSKAQGMLRKWEAGDKKVIELWKMMNNWVYKGFEETYKKLGVNFDRIYYESQTYLLGKSLVMDGLKKGSLYPKPDGSIWADLTADGLDHKVLLRSDGTSVYMTQDVGTAHQRFSEYPLEQLIYVVGNEQNYHFQALQIVLKKLGFDWYNKIEHLSYGMVELPEGKMKSREGTVVDADDLIEEMIETAKLMASELGKLEGLDDEEKENIIRNIGLGALKYYILKVDPKKNMIFDPKESIDFNGNTGPFIQYTYARIRSVMRKGNEKKIKAGKLESNINISPKEKELIKFVYDFPALVCEAANTLSPAIIANYLYELAKEYNQFYHDYPILKEEDIEIRSLRLQLSEKIAEVLKTGMELLGIEMPERM